MIDKIKSFWKSYTFTESQLIKGATFYGPASVYMPEEINFAQGTDKWKQSMYSFKLVVDRLETNKVFYYSFYIDPEGNENVSKHVRFIGTEVLLKNINKLRLWVSVDGK